MSLAVTTWNVNSIRKRLDGLADLIEIEHPDVICLQETKVEDHLFPAAEIAALGYPHQFVSGMKAYNGVAILSRSPLSEPRRLDWCDREDCRHIFAGLAVEGRYSEIELHCLYVPAGGDVPDPLKNPKFAHKLAFFDEQTHWWTARGDTQPPRVLVGDFNVAPLETDVWSHRRLRNVVTHTPVEIARLRQFQHAGVWIDAIRYFVSDEEKLFTWWSYRSGDWENADKGRRLDHIWVSRDLRRLLSGFSVLKEARGWTPASDHVPVTLRIDGISAIG